MRHALTFNNRGINYYTEQNAKQVIKAFLIDTYPIIDLKRLFKEFRNGVMHI